MGPTCVVEQTLVVVFFFQLNYQSDSPAENLQLLHVVVNRSGAHVIPENVLSCSTPAHLLSVGFNVI